MLMCAVLERRVTPQVQALAETAARQQASEAISEAVQTVLVEEKVTYETLVGIHVENGVRSIETNAMEINLLRSKINQAVEKAVRSRKGRLRLPLGALLGSQLFAGAGPKIGVPLAMTGDAVSDIRSDISGAGVNQTNYLLG
jgi:sporulation protein YunB